MRIPLPLRRGPDAISPTAHYTGHVWGRNDLSHPELDTIEGRAFFGALMPAMTVSRTLGGPTLEGMLLTRHRIIDRLLADAIEAGRVSQVIEVACGMSPRGWRFARRYGERVTYVEADLPGMAARKRRALERIGSLGDGHRVVALDALRDGGPDSLAEVASGLVRTGGLAIVTEGLLSYFGGGDVLGMWRRFARELGRFSHGLYLSDLHVGGGRSPLDRAFMAALSAYVQRRVQSHFDGEAAAVAALREAGFREARLHRGDRHAAAGDAGRDPGAARVHVVEAAT
ncbi:MAG TPA: class I SAM-dependent methyltransferase [Thermoleophilaceae bacterium]|jgi:O-methyltransferase involved in polyketide biosynthesis